MHQTPLSTLVNIFPARFPTDAQEVVSIFRENVTNPSVSLDFPDYENEFAGLTGKYSEPDGRILLARTHNAVLGCVALRRVNDNTCELKRVYVRPSARGNNTGRQLVDHMIAEARGERYSTVCLDALPEFVAAQQLYESLGLVSAEAASYNTVPSTKFLALSL